MDPLDPTKNEDKGATGGARGGGDENPKDYQFPGGPSDPADPAAERKEWERKGAKSKNPYAYQKLIQHDKDAIPMKELPKEKNGLPDPKGGEDTEEPLSLRTSFDRKRHGTNRG